MTKRLQVLLDDDELAEIQELARRRRQTTAAWVRDALRKAREDSAHGYPVADLGPMLDEIERGYLDSDRS
jgi:predicted transcriptional regulator